MIYPPNWSPCLQFLLCPLLSLTQSTSSNHIDWKKVKKSLSRVWLFATPWTIQSLKFSGSEYWSGKPFPSPGGLPNPGIEPRSPALEVNSLPAEPQGKPKNTGVGSLSLLQRILLTQEPNGGLLVLQTDSLPTELPGKPMKGISESVEMCLWIK